MKEKCVIESYIENLLNLKKELEVELESGVKLNGREAGRKLTGYEIWHIQQQIERIEIECE